VSCHRGGLVDASIPSPVTQDGLTFRVSWSRRLQVEASSFSPAVPPACHKQRARAVSDRKSRSFREAVGLDAGP
jgi:hypothetical protein